MSLKASSEDDLWGSMTDEEEFSQICSTLDLDQIPPQTDISKKSEKRENVKSYEQEQQPSRPNTTPKAAAAAAAPKLYETLEIKVIKADLVSYWKAREICLNLKNIGCWSFFMDQENQEETWSKLSHFYREGKLMGVTKISRALTATKQHNGLPIFVHCGPATEKEYIIDIGKHLLNILQFKRQKCGFNYPSRIYYKVSKGGFAHVYPGGPPSYQIEF